MPRKRQNISLFICLTAVCLLSPNKGSAAEAPFYQRKNLTLIGGYAPGGGGSVRTQVIMKFVQKYLPGNPTIVYQYMPAAGGTAAANHMANVVPRDGLTIATVGSTLFQNAIFGSSGVRYKLDDFIFLGSGNVGNPQALAIRPGLGLDSIEKLKAYKGLRFGSQSVGHSLYVVDRLVAFILDLKDPRWVLGYNTEEINLALEREEVDARTNSPHTFVARRKQFIEGGYSFPVIMRNQLGRGAEVAPEFPQKVLPLDQFADTEIKRAVLNLHNNSKPATSVFFVPKGIPEPALKALREAFNRVWQDPQIMKEYERLIGQDTDPVTGDGIHRALQALPKDPKVFEAYNQLIGAGPLPPTR